MKDQRFRKIALGITGLLAVSLAHASVPLWTFSAPNPSTVTVSDEGIGKIRYTVTNHSDRPKTLMMRPVAGLSASPCHLEGNGSTCDLIITINGSTLSDSGFQGTPVFCAVNPQGKPLPQCYQPKSQHKINVIKNATYATSLQTSVTDLALSTQGFTEYGVAGTPASGVPRVISITNTGNFEAKNIFFTSPAWPSGTYSTTTCSDTLAAAASCTITITPGFIASSDGANPCSNGTAPIPDVIEVTSANANSVSANVSILSYACIYQGGHVYAFDDTTPNTGSVGGKVATTSDQAPPFPNGIVWSSNGSPVEVSGALNPGATSHDLIPGIAHTSTSTIGSPTYNAFETFFSNNYTNPNPFSSASFSLCNGNLDGACNTENIVTFYNQFITNNTLADSGAPLFTASPGPTNLTSYAAGLCKQTINGYSDWYLPAMCETGYVGSCGTSSTPVLQNMLSSLVDFHELNLLVGDYWTSTEHASNAQSRARARWIGGPNTSTQFDYLKEGRLGVRCSRALSF